MLGSHPGNTNLTTQSKLCNVAGGDYGTVGRAVASNTRDPRFESHHWQKNANESLNVLHERPKYRQEARLKEQNVLGAINAFVKTPGIKTRHVEFSEKNAIFLWSRNNL